MSYKTLIVGGLLAAVGSASAQLTNVGPFTGTYQEGFESFPNYANGGIYDTLSIMGGEATFSSDPTDSYQLNIYSTTPSADWGLGSSYAAVKSGLNGLGLQNSSEGEQPIDVTLTFATPVFQFGGYFTSDQLSATALTFFDSANAQIGTASLPMAPTAIGNGPSPNVPLIWYGWSSTDAIKSITFTGSLAPAMDDLQAGAATPEPGTYAVLGLGTLGLLIGRRKR